MMILKDWILFQLKHTLLILIFFFVLAGCVDTHKNIFISGVKVVDLKRIVSNQTCHHKAIFIFDPTCPVCMFYLHNEYPVMQSRFSDSIDYIFISADTISFEKYKKFFQTIGIKTGRLLSLQDNNPDYLQENGKINIQKVMQYLFPNEDNMYIPGFPVSAMANKENKLKLECYVMDDSNAIIRPQPWHKLYLSNLSQIDFNIIDDCK
jgi:hypothetical protein